MTHRLFRNPMIRIALVACMVLSISIGYSALPTTSALAATIYDCNFNGDQYATGFGDDLAYDSIVECTSSKINILLTEVVQVYNPSTGNWDQEDENQDACTNCSSLTSPTSGGGMFTYIYGAYPGESVRVYHYVYICTSSTSCDGINFMTGPTYF